MVEKRVLEFCVYIYLFPKKRRKNSYPQFLCFLGINKQVVWFKMKDWVVDVRCVAAWSIWLHPVTGLVI